MCPDWSNERFVVDWAATVPVVLIVVVMDPFSTVAVWTAAVAEPPPLSTLAQST